MKTALVTGASRGIGKAVALQLAKDGYKVYVHCAQQMEKAEAVCRQIRENGGEAEPAQCDLMQLEQTEKLPEKTGNVDVLVLNASIQYRTPWQDIKLDACYEQLNCNLVSSIVLMQKYSHYMQQQKWGRIVTIGSVQETKPHKDMLVYAASKAALTNVVRSLAKQLAQDGITVNNVAPGVVDTDRNAEALSDPVYLKKVLSGIPAGYCAKAEDFAGVVSLLCSEQGRYITGQSIYADGGMSL